MPLLFSFDLLFEGKPKEDFKPKIQKFFERIEKYCPFLKEYHFKIDTQNTFPHSSGIASSASGMAALAMNIMSLEKALNPTISEIISSRKLFFLARLGSGSAWYKHSKAEVVVWGRTVKLKQVLISLAWSFQTFIQILKTFKTLFY